MALYAVNAMISMVANAQCAASNAFSQQERDKHADQSEVDGGA